MATYGNYPPNYLLFNKQLSKQLAIVMIIEGIPYIFGISDTFEEVKYGQAGLVYGQVGLVYGGLKKVGGPNGTGGVKQYIVLGDNMTIQQRIEPEQGRGNIGMITMTLIDFRGQVSYFIAPGNVVNEIMCSKQVTLYIGFQQSRFPDDYVILYRGYITGLDCPPGVVKFQISDGTMKSRQPICNTPGTNLTSLIDSSVTSIPVLSTTGFYSQILGPDSTYDPIVHTYIVIDSEIMEYGIGGIPNTTHFDVTRGVLGSMAVEHENDAPVANSIQFGQETEGGGVNFITLALKLLLSGWGGDCETNIPLFTLGYQYNTITVPPLSVIDSTAFLLLVDDAFLDLGLTVGDYFTISGATNPLNDITGKIIGFGNLIDSSVTKIIYTDQTFDSFEYLTTGVASFRSKYDTLPVLAGAKARMRDVDVSTMEMVRANYFSSGLYDVAMYYNTPVFAKDTIAADLFLPMGCYQISRFGRISISVTKPPLPGVGRLVELNYTNVLDPDKIHVNRATNNRTFYNQVSYEYDFDVVNQAFKKITYFLDTTSATNFNQVLTLPIQAKALKSIFGGGSVASIRGQALLNRYKDVALMIELTVNWSVGSLIEVSDIVLLNDNGQLKIMNFQTGERNIGAQLFEVIDRSYNVTQGNVRLKLLGGLGFSQNSRFGLIAPSSRMAAGSTGTLLRLKVSYGQTSINNEINKWTSFFGLPIVVHSPDYSVIGESFLIARDPVDVTALAIEPDLGFTPGEDYILEIANYPTDTNKNTNSKYKALYAYITPTVAIVTGLSSSQFTVGMGDVAKFIVGNLMIVRRNNWTVISDEVKITDVTGVTITVSPVIRNRDTNVPFTPDSNYYAEGLGFLDGTGYYRYD